MNQKVIIIIIIIIIINLRNKQVQKAAANSDMIRYKKKENKEDKQPFEGGE